MAALPNDTSANFTPGDGCQHNGTGMDCENSPDITTSSPAFIIQNILAVGILMSNISILIVLSKCNVMNTVMRKLFRSLAVADLIMGLAVLIRQIFIGIYGRHVEDVPLRCAPAIILFVLSGGTSISSLMFVAIGQWYTASKPLSLEQKQRHDKMMQRYIKASWMIWSFISLCSLPVTKGTGTFEKLQSPCLITGPFIYEWYWIVITQLLIVMCIITVTFQILSLRNMRAVLKRLMTAVQKRHEPYMTVLKHSHGMRLNQSAVPKRNEKNKQAKKSQRSSDYSYESTADLTFVRTAGYASGLKGGDKHELELAQIRLHLSTTLTLVMVLFAICWLMYLPLAVALLFCDSPLCLQLQNHVPYVGILPILNSLMNAIIYPLRLKPYRLAMMRMLCPKKEGIGNQVIPLSISRVATVNDLESQPNSQLEAQHNGAQRQY